VGRKEPFCPFDDPAETSLFVLSRGTLAFPQAEKLQSSLWKIAGHCQLHFICASMPVLLSGLNIALNRLVVENIR
jgi:hypothetical protein